MNISKWYDPISERWIEPREAPSIAPGSQSGTEMMLETHRLAEAQRIWQLLLDCCTRG